jgi:hypothetical protein
MPSTNSEDDFAQNVALADTPMGLGSVVKAELGGDGDVQFRFLHHAVEFFELADARFRVIRNNPQTAPFSGAGSTARGFASCPPWRSASKQRGTESPLPRTSTASTPFGENLNAAYTKSALWPSTAASAPSRRVSATPSGPDATARTFAPRSLANWIASVLTPPDAP